MYLPLWLRQLSNRVRLSRRDASRRRQPARISRVGQSRWVRPCLETLEDRITPTTFTPTVFTDGVTGNANGTLRDAILAANNDTGTAPDTIQLSAGTYQLTIANNADNHDVSGTQGDLNITSNITELIIQGATDASGKPTTIIDQTTADRVFQIVNASALVVFDDVIIEDGIAHDDGGAGTVADSTDALGGGILDDGGNVRLVNVVIQYNSALSGSGHTAKGGGIYVENGGSLTSQTSVIQSNVAIGGSGTPGASGGVEGGGISDDGGKVTFSSGTVQGNEAVGAAGSYAFGGGIAALNGSLTINNSIIRANSVHGGDGTSTAPLTNGGDGAGGGVYYFSGAANDKLSIQGSTVEDNSAVGGNGYSSGTDNGGTAEGGGIELSLASDTSGVPSVSILASTVSGNSALGGTAGDLGNAGQAKGGGVELGVDGQGMLQVINATIANNNATAGIGIALESDGGGMYLSGGTVTLTNATVADNLSRSQGGTGIVKGGGIDNSFATVTLTNTLVALNSADTGPDYNGVVSTSDHNLIGKADGSSGFSAAHGDLLGTTANPLNPQLGSLQNNGGPTWTMALLPGSPAINTGDNIVQATTGPYDQRGPGFARVVNGAIDIGAFEVQLPVGPPPPPQLPPPPPSPTPPSLHTPPLLAFFDGLLHGGETVNSDGTETVVDRIFGITLFVSTYDSAGNLMSATLFGINVTSLLELL